MNLVSIALLACVCLNAKEPLNVVLIMADDVGRECFSSYGSKQYSTPRLDTLADRGVRFTQAHSKPLCTPSRVAIMTGKRTVALSHWDGSLVDVPLRDEHSRLALCLRGVFPWQGS